MPSRRFLHGIGCRIALRNELDNPARHVDLEILRPIAERFRTLVGASSVMVDGNPLSVTASFGATLASRGDTADIVFKRADELLYRSKTEGRNRVTVG